MKNYARAYSEVLEVLKYLPMEDYKKIPRKTIQLLERYCDETCNFTYNVALPFEEQNISKDAKVILAILYRNCWLQGEKKYEFKQREKKYITEIERIKKEKYNPDTLFEKNNQIIKNKNNYPEVIKKDNFLVKIIKKIRNFLKKSNS